MKIFTASAMDFETTGLPLHPQAKLSLQPRIIEVGIVSIAYTGDILQEMSQLVDPGIEISAEITKITGITNDDLFGKPKFKDVLPDIVAMMAKTNLLFAHNLPFDKFMLELELSRLGVENFPWPQWELCTVQTYVDSMGFRPKLPFLYETIMGRPLNQTHRALDDCQALAEIVVKADLIQLFMQ